MLRSKVRTLFASPASTPVLKHRILSSTPIHHKNLTSPFSTHPQGLRRIMYTDFTWADVHRLSKTHLTRDIDGWPIPVKSRLYFDRDGTPWIPASASASRFPANYVEAVVDYKDTLFHNPAAQKCVFTYDFSREDFFGCWDYEDGFNIALCFLTRDAVLLYGGLDEIAGAAGEIVSHTGQS
jgi:hypothetical protein